jgi:hypothetical protein
MLPELGFGLRTIGSGRRIHGTPRVGWAARCEYALIAEPHHPRHSYAYVRGALKLFDGKPEIVVRAPGQMSDDPPS